MLSAGFLITSLIVVRIPGTGVVFAVSSGLTLGRQASFYAALGCTLGIAPHLLATVLGLAAALHASALAFQVLKYAGVAYLFYLAAATWRDRSAFAAQAVRGARGIFFLAFLPQFVQQGAAVSPVLQLVGLSAVFMLMTSVVFVLYGLLAHAFRRAVIESPRVQAWVRRSFAGAFVALGAQLSHAERSAPVRRSEPPQVF
ncbi:MAG: LysE family translocator [Betaproteobacteria bacterium]|nr:LysE family translocator [Betaproteobacteria bacterium]MCL2886256.1 LysE family translocator [Betaproteobacteria bacterium]